MGAIPSQLRGRGIDRGAPNRAGRQQEGSKEVVGLGELDEPAGLLCFSFLFSDVASSSFCSILLGKTRGGLKRFVNTFKPHFETRVIVSK
jgi:hypothetical protein